MMGSFTKKLALCLAMMSTGLTYAQGLFSLDLNSKDDAPGLYMKGVIKTKDDFLYNSTVKVVMDSVPFMETTANHSGKFKVFLPLNHEYIITFSNEGFVSKTITVSTKVPEKRNQAYPFKFSIDLFESIPSLDVSLLKEPVAIVTFNNFMNKFDYDYNYTVLINDDIEHLYAEYYKLKDKKSGVLHSTADMP